MDDHGSGWSWAVLVLEALLYAGLVLAVALLVWYLSCRYYLLERSPLAQELLGVRAPPTYTPSRRYQARISARRGAHAGAS